MWSYYSTELYHHGILGMKWGIRRFRNKDGTLTSEGAKRYKQLMREAKARSPYRRAEYASEEKEKAGIRKVNESQDIISKGKIITRWSNNDEKVTNKRTYASLTEDDVEDYGVSLAEGIIGDPNKRHAYKLTYEAKKDLKVASAEKILDRLVEENGSISIKELYKIDETYGKYFLKDGEKYMNLKMKDISQFLKDTDEFPSYDANHLLPYLREKAGFIGSRDEKLLRNTMKTREIAEYAVRSLFRSKVFHSRLRSKEFINSFKREGYDALVDLEDYMGGYAQYPIVLLDPEKSVKKIRSERY